jgi:hypothetical protein
MSVNKMHKMGGMLKLASFASDPASPENGVMYYNSTSNLVRQYINGGWANIASGSVSLTGQSLTNGAIIIGNGSGQSAAVTPSGDATISNTGVITIGSNKVTNAMMAQMAAKTFKGNNSGSTANASDLTAAQVTAELSIMSGDAGSGGTKGLVPAQVSGDATKFLRGDGTFASAADTTKLPLAGGTMSGNIAMGTNKVTGLANGTAASQDAATVSQMETADGFKVSKSGDTMSGNLAMGSNKVTGLAAATNSGDAVEYSQFSTATGNKLPLAGGTMSGTINMGSNKITSLTDGTSAQDAVSKTQMETADGFRVAKAGDTMSGNLAMGTNKVTGLGAGTAATDAVNKSQLDGISAGLVWLSPVQDPDLVDDSLSAPPVAPVANTTYLVSDTATGLWAGLEGRLVYTADGGTSWVDVLGRAVIVGDRFGITMEHGSGSEGGNMVGNHNKIAQITTATPGSYAYSYTTATTNQAVFVSATGSQHTGHQYTFNGTSWIEFGGTAAVSAGIGLSYSGNILNVNLGAGISQLPSDEVGVDVHTSGGLFTTVDNSTSSTVTAAQLAIKLDGSTLGKSSSGIKVATGGISNNEIDAAAAIAYSKLSLGTSIVNADIATAANIARSKLASGTNYAWATNNGSGVLSDVAVTASRAVATDSNGAPVASATTATELGYVSGVTSSIQTQIGGKIGNVVEDTTPQLGGNLDLNGHAIASPFKVGTDTNFVSESYIHTATLTASQTNTVLSNLTFAFATTMAIDVQYTIKEATTNNVRVGHLRVVCNGTDIGISDDYADSADVGVSWDAAINGADVEINYTTTANAKTFRASVKSFQA